MSQPPHAEQLQRAESVSNEKHTAQNKGQREHILAFWGDTCDGLLIYTASDACIGVVDDDQELGIIRRHNVHII